MYMTFGTPINSSLSDEEIEEIEDRFYNDGSPFEVEYNGATLNIHIKRFLFFQKVRLRTTQKNRTQTKMYIF
ncbi:hypothetical protein AAAC51_06370 [Priestia megaterium]